MSTQRNSNPRYGSGTVSGNLGRAGASAPTVPQPFQKGYGSGGLVSLGTTKKPRTNSALPERKLSVPKPVNLPSLRKENAGNDPNTQLVPSGGVGGWQKPDAEEKPEEEIVPNLTAGSSWASAPPSTSGIPSWQPPQPFPTPVSGPQKSRNLNPLEYPSLSAAATAQKQIGLPIQPVPHLPSSNAQGGGNWDEDERRPTAVIGQSNKSAESWADSKVEDERGAYRPPWDQNGHRSSDDYWSRRDRPGYTPRSFERFKEVDDPSLFPPPPPPRQPPPPPPRGELSKEEAEAEKRAFEDEIDRVIEEERKRERETQLAAAQEAARQKALEEEEAAQAKAAADQAAAQAAAKAALEAESKPPSPEEQQAALEAARQKALAARKRREAEDEEMEKKRKEAAFAKLKELEERMNARLKAEQEAKEAESVEVKSAEKALAEVQSALADAVEASAESAVTAAQEAINKEIQGTNKVEREIGSSTIDGSLASRTDLASIEADAGSSVALSESLEGFNRVSGAASEAGSMQDSKASDASWIGKPPGITSQPRAIWQRRDKDSHDASNSVSPAIGSLTESAQFEPSAQRLHEPPKGDTGTAALFAPNSNFGPALVATSLGITPEDYASGQQKAPSKSNQQAEISSTPSGPLNWRAVMGVQESEKAEVSSTDDLQASKQDGIGGRGRGRGRRDRDRLSREDSHESGGGRGRGNRDRGRGRARGRGRFPDQSSGPESEQFDVSPSMDSQTDSRKAFRGRGRGRDSEGRGRGRARGNIENNVAPPPPPPPPPISPEPQKEERPILEDDLPPGIFPSSSHAFRGSQDLKISDPGTSLPQDNINWKAPRPEHEAPPLLSHLPISKPPALDPPLDSFNSLNIEPRNDRAFDRPVDRPKSAAGPVGQPISKLDSSSTNGMPNLPHDLSLDSLGEPSKQQSNNNVSFGFQPPSQPLAPGSFQGTYFSGPQQNNPWQTQPSGQDTQPNLEAAMQSFYKGGQNNSEQSPSRQNVQPQQASSGLQFGAFSNFPQFGQLGSSFGHQPFIQTGKPADWSIGGSLVSTSQNASAKQPESQSTSQSLGSDFPRSVGMDAIVQPSNLNRRGPQSAPGHPAAPGPPGPPGLQRHPQNNQPAASTSLPGDLFSNDQAVKTPPPPPGLQNSAPSQSFYNPSRTPRSLTQQGQGQFGPQVNISFSAPPQIQNQQLQNQQFPRPQNHLPFPGVFQEPGPNQFRDGPPPGIGKPNLTPRSQIPQFPDDVFDSSTPPGAEPSFLHGQISDLHNGSQGGRRGPDMRGGGRQGRAPLRAPVPSRGRGFGRIPNLQPGRGSLPQQQHLGMLANQGFQPMSAAIGSRGPPTFPLQQGGQGGLGSIGGFGPGHGPIGEQMQGPKRAPSLRGRGRAGVTRTSQDGGPMNLGIPTSFPHDS